MTHVKRKAAWQQYIRMVFMEKCRKSENGVADSANAVERVGLLLKLSKVLLFYTEEINIHADEEINIHADR